jgi:hypothetical protein
MDTHENTPEFLPADVATNLAEEPKIASPRRIRPLTLAIAGMVTLAMLALGFLGIARATDAPSFCGSACHEMSPFHTAWSKGPHGGIACIECHTDPSPAARLGHKFVALQEVVSHLKGAPAFPLAKAPDVPDSRCVRCHEKVAVKRTGFSHAYHASRGACVKCHAEVGHKVTTLALESAGVRTVAYRQVSIDSTKTAAPGTGKASIPGHVAVACSNCHDMASLKCSDCHTPSAKHKNRPSDCTICHAPGAKFTFTHPQRTDCRACHTPPSAVTAGLPKNVKQPAHSWKLTDCVQCHKSGPGIDWKFSHPQVTTCGDCHIPPGNHKWSASCTDCHKAGAGKSFAFSHPARTDCQTCHSRPNGHRSGSCSTCHKNPGKSWSFSHPGSSATCSNCHSVPSNHRSGSCASCHRVGVSWAFSHPGSGASCANCHKRPSGHKSGACQSCHKKPGRSWAFSHPGSGASCANCHKRPSGHSSGACQNCHRNAGRSWAFSHPRSSACSSCHTPPSNHYGTSCASCHTAGTSWRNTHFSHPKTSAPHGISGKACTSCHPSNHPAPDYFCTCHGNKTGDDDD